MASVVQVVNESVQSSPKSYTVPPNLAFIPTAVEALYDGTGAASDFVPCLTLRTQDGNIVARMGTGLRVAAGGEARVSFAPFLGRGAGAIRFDTLNVGGWLDVRTTALGGPSSGGIRFVANAGDLELDVTDLLGGTFRVVAPFFYFDAQGGIYRFTNANLYDFTGDSFTMNVGAGGFVFNCPTGGVTEVDGEFQVVLPAGAPVTVKDHLNNPIFRIDEDGSIHGLATVGAITWDL